MRPCSRGSTTPAARAGRGPDEVTLVAVSKTVEPARLRDAVAAGRDDPRREPRPGGRGQDRRGRWRHLAPRRARSSRTRRAARSRCSTSSSPSTRSRWPSGSTGSPRMSATRRARATRCCSRSTSTTTRRRPASDPTTLPAALERHGDARHARGPRPHDRRPAGRRRRGRAADLHARCATCRSVCARPEPRWDPACRWA